MKSTRIGWWISVPVHLAFLGLAAVVIHEQFIPTLPEGTSFSCGWATPQVEFDLLSYPRESLNRGPVLPDGPLTFLPAKPSGEIGLFGLPDSPPLGHKCGSCCCFAWLNELPPSVLLQLELHWWHPEVLTDARPRLEFRKVERRRNGVRVGVYTWR